MGSVERDWHKEAQRECEEKNKVQTVQQNKHRTQFLLSSPCVARTKSTGTLHVRVLKPYQTLIGRDL